MSKSPQKPASTKAGVVLNVEARLKLQCLANWMKRELVRQQDLRVKLVQFPLSTSTSTGITYMSPFGALVQLFQPFKLCEAYLLISGIYAMRSIKVHNRAASILDISPQEFTKLIQYVYGGSVGFPDIIKKLRSLK